MTVSMAAKAERSLPLWRRSAQAVETVPADALTVTQVADQTGLRPSTIFAAMSSTAHGGKGARLRSLARPTYDLSGTPYWTQRQVADYHQIVAEQLSSRWEGLPVVDSEGAVELQAVSLRGLVRLSGVPLTNLYRWKGEKDWPGPLAVMRVHSSTPRLLYSWPDVREYIMTHHATWLAAHNITAAQLDDRQVTEEP